jgi:nitroimidazol reductase NimA-like FMN-containing flavoprotein (pyridoxamine 5'-phosphate oxidase superfamily)
MEERAPSAVETRDRIDVAEDIFAEHPTMSVALNDDGAPWIAKVFFVDDEPHPGAFDLCCSLLLSSRKMDIITRAPQVAFVVAGELPDRWIQGTGRAEIVTDEADAAAIAKRLEEKSAAAGPFLSKMPCTAVRIHIERMKLTDLRLQPPITEFTFA